MGTRNGLWFFNSQTHSFYEYSLKKSNIRYDVRSLLLEGDNLWVGTLCEGLHVLNLKTGILKVILIPVISRIRFAVMMY